MLALKAGDIEDGLKRVGIPAEVEYKYDGFRIQIHRDKDIKLFTRRLENVTLQFPDVVRYAKEHVKGASYILDCEAVGYDPKTKKYLPFQNISQRIKRKYNIEQMSKDFPVEVNVFDIIYHNGKSLIRENFKDRRALLEKIIKPALHRVVLARNLISENKKEIDKFYKESLKAGNEGIMLKKMDAPYKPGARVGYMVKIKPTMETLDLVIVGAEWGEGKRSNWLSSFTLACRGEKEFLEIGKVGTGIKEKSEGISFEQLTKLLNPLIQNESRKKVLVKPKIMVEVGYEEIQKSPTYSSGYALRFPRIIRLREDKSAKQATELDYVEKLFLSQDR
jgi:DNA ligase-1